MTDFVYCFEGERQLTPAPKAFRAGCYGSFEDEEEENLLGNNHAATAWAAAKSALRWRRLLKNS